MGMKLVLSNFKHLMDDGVYIAFCLTVDIFFRICSGIISSRIDHCKLAIYHRQLMSKYIGVKKYKSDVDKMKHTKSLSNKDGDHTKFTYHNVEWHSIFDYVTWWNIAQLAQCKVLEKTNKRTKDSIRKGVLSATTCNKVMEHRMREFVFMYLLEGNTITEDGKFDPINGKYKISTETLQSVHQLSIRRSLSWFSVFFDKQHNPTRPEYTEGCVLQSKQPGYGIKLYRKNVIFDIDELVWSNFGWVIESIQYYKWCHYWRKFKKYIVGIGSIVCRQTDNNRLELCFVTGIATIRLYPVETVNVIFGHSVKVGCFENGERNIRGSLNCDMVCWNVNDIYSNVYYMHLCHESGCKVINDKYVHNWDLHPNVSLFWYLGIGKTKCLGNPLIFFDEKKLYRTD